MCGHRIICNSTDKKPHHTDLYNDIFGGRYTFVISNQKIMTKESFHINGENLVKKVKELIAEGNVRKITIYDKYDKELASFPLTFGLIGVLVLPMLAAVGAIAALIGECKIMVEREDVANETQVEYKDK